MYRTLYFLSPSTFANNVKVKVKKIFNKKIQYFFENYNLTPLDICTMDCPKIIVSKEKEEPISIQRVKGLS